MAARDRSRSPRRRGDGTNVVVYHNGQPWEFEFVGVEDAAEKLQSWGIIDEDCATFLVKASEEQALQILQDLGPSCKNPSAVLTRKLKSLLSSGQLAVDSAIDTRPFDIVTVYLNGAPKELKWFSKRQAIGTLIKWGVLDESSSDFLMKAPDLLAAEIVQSLGPDCRNASAVVTKKMKELVNKGAIPELDVAALQTSKPRGKSRPPVEVLTVYHHGVPKELEWHSLHHAVQTLVHWGMLDDGSAGFLAKAPEHHAKNILAHLGPTVKNPSAVVTKKLKELRASGVPFAEGEDQLQTMEAVGNRMERDAAWHHRAPLARDESAPSEYNGRNRPATSQGAIIVHKDGEPLEVQWTSLRNVAGALYAYDILDDKSACFLVKAPAAQAKDLLVSALGPKSRNPSATVTKALKQLQLDGAKFTAEEVEELQVYCNGEQRSLRWFSLDTAAQALLNWKVLDEGSAGFLTKAPESHAKRILADITPEARNPSAVVTKKLKELQAQGVPFSDADVYGAKTTSSSTGSDAWGKSSGSWSKGGGAWGKGGEAWGKGDTWGGKGADVWGGKWGGKGGDWSMGGGWGAFGWGSGIWDSWGKGKDWGAAGWAAKGAKNSDFEAGWAAAMAALGKGGGK